MSLGGQTAFRATKGRFKASAFFFSSSSRTVAWQSRKGFLRPNVGGGIPRFFFLATKTLDQIKLLALISSKGNEWASRLWGLQTNHYAIISANKLEALRFKSERLSCRGASGRGCLLCPWLSLWRRGPKSKNEKQQLKDASGGLTVWSVTTESLEQWSHDRWII